ncbi:hypothetical protein SELMODRAFT_151778 [Selaginella moellendorffii]|uniref:Serine-threonine kinase receptor-associated protein n=1 Tax=Selaginella moellendorffii TaxID=88036 RepID=D8S1P0_SELML|nr:serine-threonine kinase receptor-associated protein [Selaginella moellendorffii]EFJ21886.1 hypothetical protein SELMODRAFT_151778 [Selaginella moellendorffii]|eukprot:XP_002977277.1 serine-threonine kinase receptor-associated protein [Selaginella moellendorffii]
MEKRKAQVPLVCHGHSRPIVDLFYSPVTADGFFLISASKDGKPMLRNGGTGDWIGTFEGHKGAVWAACLDTPALRAATASADFSARVWDALTGDELYSFEHKHIVRTCAFSESTTLLLTGGQEKILRIYDLERPDAAPTEMEGLTSTIRSAVWHHSDQTILSSCNDTGSVRLWDVRTKTTVRQLETKSPCTSVEVSRDGRYITTADGNSVKFWDANHFGMVKSFTMARPMESASLYPALGKFVAGGDDMWVRVFDFYTGEEIECCKGHHGPVHCVRFSPGGESFASGSEDGTIRIWQTGESGGGGGGGGGAGGAEESGSAPPKITVSAEDVARKVEGFHIEL